MNFTLATRSEYQFVDQIRLARRYHTGKSGKYFKIHYRKGKLKPWGGFLDSGLDLLLLSGCPR